MVLLLWKQFVLTATPSAADHFWLLGSAIWGPWCIFLDILGGTLAPRGHLWEFFSISGVPGAAILAPRERTGGPREQQDGHAVVSNRIFVDFDVRFWSPVT